MIVTGFEVFQSLNKEILSQDAYDQPLEILNFREKDLIRIQDKNKEYYFEIGSEKQA